MSDLISRQAVIDIVMDSCLDLDKWDDTDQFCKEIEALPSADIMECARAMKEYCEKHRNEHNFYMCDTCEYSSSGHSAYLDKCPFNVPAYWNLPEPHEAESVK